MVALFFSLQADDPTPVLSAQNPGIRGDIKITNDCSGNAAHIPTNVKLSGKLYDDQGNFVGDNDTAALGTDPNNPVKRGTYFMDVSIHANWGTTKEWKISITDNNDREICREINRCAAGTSCKDQVSKPVVVTYTGWAMTKEIKVACSCV